MHPKSPLFGGSSKCVKNPIYFIPLHFGGGLRPPTNRVHRFHYPLAPVYVGVALRATPNYIVENQRKGKSEPKKVVYYLAELMNPKENNVKLSNEHQDFKWLPLKETCKISGFKDLNEAFEKSLVKIESLSPVDFAT